MPRVTITVPEQTPQPYRFQLDRRKVTLGRSSENDIHIDCASVSGKHAEMVRIDGGYELRDVGSTNGTKDNGERRMVVPLHSGSSVQLGDVTFDFELSEEELTALAHEAPSSITPTAPLPEAKPQADSLAGASAASGRSGAVMFLLFLVLAAIAFVGGMALRRQKETQKESKPVPATAPATGEAAAPATPPAEPAK